MAGSVVIRNEIGHLAAFAVCLRCDLNEKMKKTASGTVSALIESVNRKFGGRFTVRQIFESVTNRLGIGYLPVTGWM